MKNYYQAKAKIVARGLTITEVANILNITRPTLYKRLRGEKPFTAKQKEILKDQLGLLL